MSKINYKNGIKFKCQSSGNCCISRGSYGFVYLSKNDLTRFAKHFDNIISLRKKLEEAMTVVDKFGTDARSITRTLENIKDPEQIEKAIKTENVEKFENHSKQLKN